MECHVKEVEQGSDEWLALRRCRITASRLGVVMSKPSTQGYQKLQRQIAQELNGYEPVEEDAPWFAHGKEQEPRALGQYQWEYNVNIAHDVFLIHKEYDWFGASPDLFEIIPPPADQKPDLSICDTGGEIKCRAMYKTYLKYVRMAEKMEAIDPFKSVPAENRFQVQGAMWMTGFESWYFINYYEGHDFEGREQRLIHRVEIPRDQDLIDRMELRCLAFMRECHEIAGV